MASGQTLHAEAVRHYQERGMLSQKDLMQRWGFNNPRAVQRARKEFNMRVGDWWGVNPLFTLTEVLRVEAMRRKKRDAMIRSKSDRFRKFKLLSVKQAKRRAGRKARK